MASSVGDAGTARDATYAYVRRVATALALGGGAVGLFWVVWRAHAVLFLLFAGVLLGVLLHGMAARLARRVPLGYRACLLAVTALLLGGVALLFWWRAPHMAEQARGLSQELPRAAEQLREQMARHDWMEQAISQLPPAAEILSPQAVMGQVRRVFSSSFGLIADTVLVLFVGLYLAFDPGLYRRGLLHLVPPGKRRRVGEVLDELNGTLWSWLLARLLTMTLVGVLVWLGLTWIGVPMAFSLGLLAALLDFVPFVGPLLSWVPAALLALLGGPSQLLWVSLLYLGVQQLEGNVITPVVQKKAVDLPPALTLGALALFGLLAGFFGVLLATPLTAVLIVLVRELYVRDYLGDRTGDDERGGEGEKQGREGLSGDRLGGVPTAERPA